MHEEISENKVQIMPAIMLCKIRKKTGCGCSEEDAEDDTGNKMKEIREIGDNCVTSRSILLTKYVWVTNS